CSSYEWWYVSFFFFQAEDGIRDFHVTGVQTCALPIWVRGGGNPDNYCSAIPPPNLPYKGGGIVIVLGTTSSTPDRPSRAPCRDRSEERRVGKEGRARWSRDH